MFEEGIIRNAIKCPDGTVIESRHRWHFVTHIQEDFRKYSVDGGCDYQTIIFCDRDFENLCVHSTDDFESIREAFTWGTFGKDGDEPLHYIKLKDMSTDHIINVLENCRNSMYPAHIGVMVREIMYRDQEV